MKEDVGLYTIRHMATELALLEEHLKEFSQGAEETFCLDCQLKHILLLNGFTQECIGFDCKPKTLIGNIKKWGEALIIELKDLTKEEAPKVISQARHFRKALEKQLINPEEVLHLKEI